MGCKSRSQFHLKGAVMRLRDSMQGVKSLAEKWQKVFDGIGFYDLADNVASHQKLLLQAKKTMTKDFKSLFADFANDVDPDKTILSSEILDLYIRLYQIQNIFRNIQNPISDCYKNIKNLIEKFLFDEEGHQKDKTLEIVVETDNGKYLIKRKVELVEVKSYTKTTFTVKKIEESDDASIL